MQHCQHISIPIDILFTRFLLTSLGPAHARHFPDRLEVLGTYIQNPPATFLLIERPHPTVVVELEKTTAMAGQGVRTLCAVEVASRTVFGLG